jgi:hypothetical protein
MELVIFMIIVVFFFVYNYIMMRILIVFIAGVYIGQEYGNTIPNVKIKSYELYESFKRTEFYKKISEDFKK